VKHLSQNNSITDIHQRQTEIPPYLQQINISCISIMKFTILAILAALVASPFHTSEVNAVEPAQFRGARGAENRNEGPRRFLMGDKEEMEMMEMEEMEMMEMEGMGGKGMDEDD
jgi:hypothetical protein